MKFLVTQRDALRGSVAGAQGAAARGAAQALFDAGGRSVLPAAVQGAVRSAVERQASLALAGVGLLESGAATTARAIERGAGPGLVVQTTRAAGRQILRGVGAAAGAGAILDGGWALVHAVRGVRGGSMTRREAAGHVLREACTGAAATAAGTLAAVALVAVTGGIAAPAVFLVGAAASVGAKAGLDRWLKARDAGAIQAVVEPSI
ncbi:MAG TPA: hypothetical protein VH137_10035 [Gemmatimonadales bacterium]|nr:hypothetical protein [Gemmatimonadales bacterium]